MLLYNNSSLRGFDGFPETQYGVCGKSLKPNVMLILDFLKELANIYATLNPTVSLCYHMSDQELFLGNVYGSDSQRIESENYDYKPANTENAFAEMILAWTDKGKKVKCVYVNGMYFIPGSIDDAIIFGKDLSVVTKDSWMIEGVTYEIVRL